MVAKPWKRPSLSQLTSTTATATTTSNNNNNNNNNNYNSTTTAADSLPQRSSSSSGSDPKSDILAASRKPSANYHNNNIGNGDVVASPGHIEQQQQQQSRPNTQIIQEKLQQPSPAPSRPKPIPAEKPQFYFGQNPSSGSGALPISPNNNNNSPTAQKQTAIDKVKNNEAVSHPKNIIINPGYKLKEYVNPMEKSGKPNFAFGDTPPSATATKPVNGVAVKPVLENHNHHKQQPESVLEDPIEPRVKPVIMNYSKFAPPSSSSSPSPFKLRPPPPTKIETEFKMPRPHIEPKPKRSSILPSTMVTSSPAKSQSQDEIRRVFESELKAGKRRLKSYESDGTDSGSNSVSPGPGVPIIPPPPPPQFSGNGTMSPPVIPPAPKLTNFPGGPSQVPRAPSNGNNKTASGKRIVAPKSNGVRPMMGGRDELLLAIRGVGGFRGLKKVLN